MERTDRKIHRYRLSVAKLADMVATLAEELSDAHQEQIDADNRAMKDTYVAERTKYDDKPLSGWGYIANVAERITTTGGGRPHEEDPAPADPTYSIPHPPPQEYRVIDDNGRRWVHTKEHGIFARVLWLPDMKLGRPAYDNPETYPAELSWVELLASYGPVRLDKWTEEEQAGFALYGPPGERWGNPYQECPYYACTIGWGHTGPHIDAEGNPIQPAEADGTTVNASITPQESAETPCTCGHPDRHRPDCPRYARVSGVASDEHREDPAENPESYEEF